MTPLWTVQDVATWLKIGRNSAYAMAARGELPCRKVGNRVRFIPSELFRWLGGVHE